MANAIVNGTATEQEQGIALRALQTNLAAQMVSGLNGICKSLSNLDNLLNHAYMKLHDRYEVDLANMDSTHLLNIIDSIQSKQLQVLDLYRKVVQGKNLFPEETISEEERKVLRLINSFTNDKDKKKFLALVDNMLKSSNDFSDSEDSTSDDTE